MITFIYEDKPIETVIEKILRHQGNISPIRKICSNGRGKIEKNIHSYLKTSQSGYFYLVVADLDNAPCAAGLIQKWLGNTPPPPTFLLRLAVREVESWIMADRENFADFLGIPLNKVPHHPDDLPDPKQTLFSLAKKSRKREIQKGIPPKDDFSRHGVEYIAKICSFVTQSWNLENAIQYSPSLKRACERMMAWRPKE